jgi:hypothetical protein
VRPDEGNAVAGSALGCLLGTLFWLALVLAGYEVFQLVA